MHCHCEQAEGLHTLCIGNKAIFAIKFRLKPIDESVIVRWAKAPPY